MSNYNATNATPPNVSLNVFINKHKTKVLFAEASSDFINVLLSFLTIPLGKIVTILQKHNESAAIGSLTTLSKGLSELDAAHFSTPGAKQMVLNPRSSFLAECHKLAVDVVFDIARPQCRAGGGGAFVTGPSIFIVSDDLRVALVVTGILQSLANFGIADTRGAEMKSFSLGLHEVRELLMLSLTSATPLTDFILMKKTVENPQSGIRLDHIHQCVAATWPRDIVLRAWLHNTTNTLLFVEATDELLDLLCSFLTVPLGGVEFLLGNNTPLKNIDNLYRSVSTGFDDKHFATPDTKNRLINPKLPHSYLSTNQLRLPLSEESPKPRRTGYHNELYQYGTGRYGKILGEKSSNEAFVNKQTMCFVNDDLSMSPSLATRISILNDLGIPLAHVKETEFHIGLNEALGILKASLISKTALSDGFIKPMLKRQAKKEGTSKRKLSEFHEDEFWFSYE